MCTIPQDYALFGAAADSPCDLPCAIIMMHKGMDEFITLMVVAGTVHYKKEEIYE